MTTTQPILLDDSTHGVRVMTLNRPHRLNAFDGQSLTELVAVIRECTQTERDIRVIVIRARGRAFCAGNDLKWLASGVLTDTAAHLRHQDKMQEAFDALEGARQIVIASVRGHAVAGGFELALVADIRVVVEDAELGGARLVLPGDWALHVRSRGRARGACRSRSAARLTDVGDAGAGKGDSRHRRPCAGSNEDDGTPRPRSYHSRMASRWSAGASLDIATSRPRCRRRSKPTLRRA